MSAWQPIATAPKDGTEVILYDPAWTRATTGIWDEHAGFWCYGDDYWFKAKPTHWQPLPEPPK